MKARAGRTGEAGAKGQLRTRKVKPAQFNVRPARPGDLVPLTFFFDSMLRNDYFLRRGQLADMLGSKYHQVYVAELDAILVGVAITTRGSQLVNVLVHPAYRGLRIGRALLRYSGARSVRAKVDMSTGDPRGFYRAMGFEATGERRADGNIEVMRPCQRAVAGGGNGPAKSRGTLAKRRQRTPRRTDSAA